MEAVEREIRNIFDKKYITEKDVERSKELFRVWKHWKNWKEDESFPIKAY